MRRLSVLEYFTINIYWLVLSYFLNGIGRFVQPAMVEFLAPQAIKATALGVLASAGLIVATVVQPLMGALSDRSTLRWGRRRPFILVGTLLDLACLALIGLSGNYWVLFVAILFLQFSTNTAHGALQGLIPDLAPQKQRGKVVGVKQFLEILGLIATSLITARFMNQAKQLFDQGQYSLARSQVWMALGVIMILLVAGLLLTLLLVREKPLEEKAKGSALSAALRTFNVDVVKYSDYVWLLIARLFILMGVYLVSTYAVYFLDDVVGLPNAYTAAGDLLATIAVVILMTSYPAGYLCDRLGRKPLNILSGPVGALGALLLLSSTGEVLFSPLGFGFSDILVYGSIMGLSMGIFLSANWTLATDLIPPEEAGKYLGISNLATAGSGVLGGLIGGPIIDFFNARQAGQGYTAAFLLSAGCFLLGTLLFVKVREVRRETVLATG
ncbi:MAG: MFS transporter [Anaerolineae bacterium]